MITAGIDAGTSATKAVILHDNGAWSYIIMPVKEDSQRSAEIALGEVLKQEEVSYKEITGIITTGLGGKGLPFGDGYISSITCALKGTNKVLPTMRTLVDVGAEGFIVAQADASGNLVNYEQHQKCGSGGGLFLEVAAQALELDVTEMGELALQSTTDMQITATCAVFAESEIISLVHRGVKREDILNAVHHSVAGRIASLLGWLGLEKDVAFVGGVARNIGMVKALEKATGVKIAVPETPEVMAALGAAILARERKEGISS